MPPAARQPSPLLLAPLHRRRAAAGCRTPGPTAILPRRTVAAAARAPRRSGGCEWIAASRHGGARVGTCRGRAHDVAGTAYGMQQAWRPRRFDLLAQPVDKDLD